jgi:hypothetical protein
MIVIHILYNFVIRCSLLTACLYTDTLCDASYINVFDQWE